VPRTSTRLVKRLRKGRARKWCGFADLLPDAVARDHRCHDAEWSRRHEGDAGPAGAEDENCIASRTAVVWTAFARVLRACICLVSWMILIGLAAIAVLTYPAWGAAPSLFPFPFHRLGERIGMVALLCVFLLFARRLGVGDRKSLGYGSPRRSFCAKCRWGCLLGVVTMGGGRGNHDGARLAGLDGSPATSMQRVLRDSRRCDSRAHSLWH